jgi:hypothetical protein
VRHGFIASRYRPFQPADQPQDAAQRFGVNGNLFGFEREARKACDGFNLAGCEAHVKKAAIHGKNSFK